ncbi:MAG: DUF6599 family protein [Bacteroidales bacterium]|nr:DUF6599 family protein [Bacteroidales bacterium]
MAFFISYAAISQVPEGFPYINNDRLEAGKIKSERIYTKESLFGYMNGGAELYLEYGFDRLVVSEIDIGDTEYKVEVYKMNDPEAAYGIYSVSVFRCDTSGHLDDYACQAAYQLQVCKGLYYISIINNSGKARAADLSIDLANRLLTLIPGNSFVISEFMPENVSEEEILRTVLVKGELGLFNGAFDWSDILQDVDNYTGLLIEASDKSMLILRFNDDMARLKFFEKHGIRSCPEINEEINIDQNTSLLVNTNRVIISRRES